jgi:hypothetical protein
MEAETAFARVEQGMQFLAVGSDLRMMLQSAEHQLRQLYPDGPQRSTPSY